LIGAATFLAERIDAATDKPHVGILLPTSGAFPAALLATWLTGRAAVPINYLLSEDERRYVIQDCGIDTLITAGPMLDFIGGEKTIPGHVQTLRMDRVDFQGIPPLRFPPLPTRNDLGVILYTSGTSGRPKGVMLSHGNLHHNVKSAIIHSQLTSADAFMGVLPQFHSFGLTALTLLPLYLGSRVVYTARFVPRRIVNLIREHRPEIFMAVPSMYGALLSVKEAGPDDFKSVRLPISGGEPLPDAVFDGLLERFGLKILEGFGLTETSPMTNWCTPTRWKRHSVGPALPEVEFLIIDPHERPLPANTDGEILIHGPNVMQGYYRLPQQTQDVFCHIAGKRWFRTGDIGRLDDDGFLYITGRKKEMLIIGGENVFPREIEEVLNLHPSVAASAVIGKQDGLRGEVPVAFIEMRDGQPFDEPALRTWCREKLAQFKVPRDIRHIEQLPRNPTGKIMRRMLKV
jgi:long-chain acyl-CoA synthetase